MAKSSKSKKETIANSAVFELKAGYAQHTNPLNGQLSKGFFRKKNPFEDKLLKYDKYIRLISL